MRRRSLAALLASLAAVGVSALTIVPASAAEDISMQAGINPDGSGRLFVNNSGGPWSWESCTPDRTSCKPFGKGREINTTGARSETVFRVTSSGATGVSPEWRGRLKQISPPTVHGLIRANEFVSPVPGRWSGGWSGEFSQMQLSACPMSAGQECTPLTNTHYARSCAGSSSFTLDARFTGSYLRVAESRIGAGPPVEPAYGVTSPYVGEVWGSSRITSVAILGQIAPVVNPYPGECGPPPASRASISKQGLALIECPAGCRAALIGSRNGRHVRIERSLPEHDALIIPPPTSLQLPSRTLVRLGAGSVHLVVEIDGEQVAQRTVRSAADN